MRKLYQILYNVGRLTDAPGRGLFLSRGDTLAVGLFPFLGDTLAWAGLRGGKALGVTKPAFPPRAPPFQAHYIVVRCGNVLMYWHGDVFYGIDNATLRRCIHPAPSTTFSPAASRLACNPTHHRHSIPSALKYQPVRFVLPVGGLCRRGADS